MGWWITWEGRPKLFISREVAEKFAMARDSGMIRLPEPDLSIVDRYLPRVPLGDLPDLPETSVRRREPLAFC